MAAAGPAQAEEAFRRARGLLRADQLETWLAGWEITAEDFRRWTEDVATGTATASPWCAALCSGAFDRAAADLAAAAAAACELGDAAAVTTAFDPSGWTDRLVAEHATPEALAAVVGAHRLDWTLLTTATLTVARRGVAEEVRHQVLHDGHDLTAVASAAGLATRTGTEVLTAYDPLPVVRAALAGARAGDLVGPLPAGDAWALIAVDGRTEPDPVDPGTRARATSVVRADVIARALARHVVA